MNEGQDGKRVLLIGLDGFEQSIADRFMAENRMPHLKRLLRDGAMVSVDHGNAKRTGLAWEHFSTGLAPAGAKRWSAVTFDKKHYEYRQFPTQLLPFPAHLPLRTVVFDPPYFDLKRTEKVSGMVCWGAHDPGTEPHARPASLTQEIEERFGPYPATPFIYGYTWASEARSQTMANDLVEAVRKRADITEWLLRDRLPDWDLGIVVVSEFHSAAEALWHGVDANHPLHHLPSADPSRRGLEGVYEALDSMLVQMQSAFPDCALLLFSPHGMGANDSDVASMSLLPEFLYRRHFERPLLVTGDEDPTALVQVGEDESWTSHVRARFQQPELSTSQRTRLLRQRLRHVRQRWESKLRVNWTPGRKQFGQVRSVDWMPVSWYAPYWPVMPAFAMPSFYDGQVRINVRGREAKGFVDAKDYDSLCQAIADNLETCVDPRTGQSVISEVIFTHPGDPFSVHETEADMIILWKGSPLAMRLPDDEVIGPIAYRRPGGHTGGDGFALWVGKDFSPGNYERRSAFDVVPSLIDYLVDSNVQAVDGESFLPMITGETDQ